jgi:hypothetical protein
MTVRLVGAGIGRTGTHSLKLALEQLLGGPCYHMIEVFGHPEHVAEWHKAMKGEPTDWESILGGYEAIVDWPGGAVWREMSEAYPDAVILLSTRSSADAWWKSANDTIFGLMNRGAPPMPGGDEWYAMVQDMFKRFTEDWSDEAAAKEAYERHNAAVRAEAPADRLVDWQPGDGWEPLCTALGVPVPDEPFPHVNTTEEFLKMMDAGPPT